MKIDNFRELKTLKLSSAYTVSVAKVDVTTGFLWWKKVRTELVARYGISEYWCFVSTGSFCPGHIVEDLARRYEQNEMTKKAGVN